LRTLNTVLATSALSLLTATCADRSDPSVQNIAHYDIDLTLDPQAQFLDAKVDLTFRSPIDSLDHATFYLHRQLSIRSVTGPELSEYDFDTQSPGPNGYMPEAGTVRVRFQKPLEKDESIDLHFEYEGTITGWPEGSANVLTDDWTELGLYFPWFPYNYDDYGPFTFALAVHADSTYNVRSYGDHELEDGTWHFQWNRPAKDIVLVAARGLKTMNFSRRRSSINIHYVSIHDSTAQHLAEDVLDVMDTYVRWFGGEQPRRVSLIVSLRERGGGYARSAAIVLSNLGDHEFVERRVDYVRFLSHETAHLWWTGAATDSWEDWLNESFAEYSALLAVRERFGEEEFERRLELKRQRIEDTPPLWEFDRDDTSTERKALVVQKILYDKGPIFLHALAQRIGEESFLLLCGDMVENGVTSTSDLLELLEVRADMWTRIWLEGLLRFR
jgi:aminopeptidase N